MSRKGSRWFLPETPDVIGMLQEQAAITVNGMEAFTAWAGGDSARAADVRAAAHDQRRDGAAAGGPLDLEIDSELLVPALDLGEIEPHGAGGGRGGQADRDLGQLRLCGRVTAENAGDRHEADGHGGEACGGSGQLRHGVHLLSLSG